MGRKMGVFPAEQVSEGQALRQKRVHCGSAALYMGRTERYSIVFRSQVQLWCEFACPLDHLLLYIRSLITVQPIMVDESAQLFAVARIHGFTYIGICAPVIGLINV